MPTDVEREMWRQEFLVRADRFKDEQGLETGPSGPYTTKNELRW